MTTNNTKEFTQLAAPFVWLAGLNKSSKKELTLWSCRWSVAKGNHFVAERSVTEETAQDWLKIFREDEPNVLFLVCKNKPKNK